MASYMVLCTIAISRMDKYTDLTIRLPDLEKVFLKFPCCWIHYWYSNWTEKIFHFGRMCWPRKSLLWIFTSGGCAGPRKMMAHCLPPFYWIHSQLNLWHHQTCLCHCWSHLHWNLKLYLFQRIYHFEKMHCPEMVFVTVIVLIIRHVREYFTFHFGRYCGSEMSNAIFCIVVTPLSLELDQWLVGGRVFSDWCISLRLTTDRLPLRFH